MKRRPDTLPPFAAPGLLQRQRKANLFLVSLVVVALIALFDARIRHDLSLSLFYLLPVFLTAWYLGRPAGVGIVLLTATLWTLSDALSQALPTTVLLWNLFIRIGFLYTFISLLLRLRRGLERETALSRTDPLTGAANARAFYEVAQLELGRSERYGSATTVVYFDLDNFKTVNDSLGHQVGDELLRQVVRTTQGNVRATDTVTRIGGDEFVILMPETDARQAQAAAHKLRALLLRAMQERGWPVTFSIGVYTFHTPPPDIPTMIEQVDGLMYEVKRGVKDGVRFASDVPANAPLDTLSKAPTSTVPKGPTEVSASQRRASKVPSAPPRDEP